MLSTEVLDWARTAHYVAAIADEGDLQLRLEVGARRHYFIPRRGSIASN
jgi:hypothetical protein